jgi:small subunit ribosomal protein S1
VQERPVTEPEDDFATMFEASERARRVTKGQIIDGTIVAIGAEVALVSVGGKSEAEIDISELLGEDGKLEVKVGDRIQAMVVSTAGALRISRRLALGAANARQLEDAFQAGLPVEARWSARSRAGMTSELPPARLLSVLADRHHPQHRAGAARRPRLQVPHRRIQGGRPESRRVAPCAARRGAASAALRGSVLDRRRRGDDRARGLGSRLWRVRRSGWRVQGLLHVSEMAWARVSDTTQVVKPGDEMHVKVLRVTRTDRRFRSD